MKNRFSFLSFLVACISLSILSTIYLSWLAYPYMVSVLEIRKLTGMSMEQILPLIHRLLIYLTSPFSWKLDISPLSSSMDGLHHFFQVKLIFHLVQILFLLSIPGALSYCRQILVRGLAGLHHKIYRFLAIFPFGALFLVLLVGFDQFFILFHQLLFVGDQTWLFDPATDPVIYLLPESYFMLAFLLFFVLYQTIFIFLTWKTRPRQPS